MSCWFQIQQKFAVFQKSRAHLAGFRRPVYYNLGDAIPLETVDQRAAIFSLIISGFMLIVDQVLDARKLRMSLQNADFTDNHWPELNHSRSLSASGSIRELGRYRSFLRLRAIGMVSGFRAKLEHSDIVQQTLLDAHQNLHQFRGSSGAEMAKWLSQILAHNVADAARALTRKKRDVRRECSLENNGDSANIRPNDWLASEQTTPSLCVSRNEQLRRLNDAIQKLPVAQQEVIVFHHLQGRSLNETAELIGRTPPAVAGLLFRGLKTLRTLLAYW